MFVYLILLLLIIFIFHSCKDKKKALLISFVFITVLACLRKYTVGADTKQFYDFFTYIREDVTWNFTNFRYEPGFYYLCKLLGMITEDAQILIVFSSIFINVGVYYFIKKNSPDLELSCILYIIMLFFFQYMNIMRQAMAIVIILFGFEFLKKNRYLEYFVFIMLAFLFHKISIIGLLPLFFTILPNRKIVYLLEVILAVVTFVFYKQLFDIFASVLGYSGYATSQFGTSNYFGSLILAAEILFILLLIILSTYKAGKIYNGKNIKLLTIVTFLYLWFEFLVVRMIVFNRIANFFGIYMIIMIPTLLEQTKKDNVMYYNIIKNTCCFIFFVSFIIISILRPEWHGVIPYTLFFT